MFKEDKPNKRNLITTEFSHFANDLIKNELVERYKFEWAIDSMEQVYIQDMQKQMIKTISKQQGQHQLVLN